jgi:tetratricopeptide (TPR) repeat protein
MRLRFGRIFMIGLGAGALAALASQAPARSPDDAGETHSLLGNYLAGRFAKGAQDTSSAAGFYSRALTRDPQNEVLLEQAFQMEVMNGNWQAAVPLAEQLAASQPNHRMSRFLLGISAFKAGNYAKAEEQFKAASENPIGELTSAIARGWTRLAAGDGAGALAAVDLPKQPEWAQFYLRYHRALMADTLGKKDEAGAAYERMFRQDSRTLRTALAYARHKAHYGNFKEARKLLNDQFEKSQGEPHPLAKDLRDQIDKKVKLPLLLDSAPEGLAEVFYGLGEALTGEGGVSLGTVYLRLALFAKPDHTFALAALASAQEQAQRYEDAIATYDQIAKGSPLQSAIDIRKAFNLNSLEKADEAQILLDDLAKREPRDVRPLEALGNIMRARKRYDEAVRYFTRAIDIIGKPDDRHWTFYYARGTAYERMKNWPAAESDLKKALALAPDQALVLNYLGYSWIDQGKNMKEGMRLIEKAVALKPDDGYIVDSLGWAHYKQGNYKEAVRYLERAVEIRPEDPTLNDHLGDAFWQIGRFQEAKFQWSQALTLNPEPEDLDKIKLKLANGLPTKAEAKKTAPRAKQAQRADKNKRTESKVEPEKPFFE